MNALIMLKNRVKLSEICNYYKMKLSKVCLLVAFELSSNFPLQSVL